MITAGAINTAVNSFFNSGHSASPEENLVSIHSLTDFAGYVRDHATDTGFGLESNIVSQSELPELLSNGIFPFLAEICRGQAVTIVLITSFRGNHVRGIEFTSDGPRDLLMDPQAFTAMVVYDQDNKTVLHFPLAFKKLFPEKEEEKKPSPLFRLFQLFHAEKRDILLIWSYALMTGLISLTLPVGIQAIFGQISGGMILEPALILIALVIFGTAAAGGLQMMQLYIVEVLQRRLFARATLEFTFRIPRIRLEKIAGKYPPELVNRFFDILTVQKGFSKILNEFLGSFFQIIFGLLLLAIYHPAFVIFGLILSLLLFGLFRMTGPAGLKSSIEESDHKYRVAHWLEELARALTTFKLAGRQKLASDQSHLNLAGYLQARKRHFRIILQQFAGIVGFKVLVTGGLLILGAILVVNRQISLGQFVASEIVIITIINAVEKIFLSLDTIYDLLTAADKLGKVTDLQLERQSGDELEQKPAGISIEAQNLSFRFPGQERDVIHDISLHIRPGEKIGITGYNHAGKTTLLQVITGLYSGYRGMLNYDNIPLANLSFSSVRNQIGDNLTYEDVIHGTVRENITMGREDISMRDVIETAGLTQIHDFVSALPQGYDTQLIAGGRGLPSAVVKKIILTRSLVRKPRLLVFDDFFYNLESGFKSNLFDHIMKPDTPWTVIAVTHDIDFLARCDSIFLMDAGRIIKSGSFQEIRNEPAFKDAVPKLIV